MTPETAPRTAQETAQEEDQEMTWERTRKAVLSIDRDVCGGMGLCEAMHPTLFRLGADGVGEVLKTELDDPGELAAARAVRDCCPTEAVLLRTLAD